MSKQARVDVTINDEQAKARLEEIKNDLKQIRALRDKAAAEGDVRGFNQLDKEMKKLTREANRLQREVIDVNDVLNNLSGASINQLRGSVRKLNAEMKGMSRTDPKFLEKKQQLSKLNAELNKATGRTKAHASGLNKLADGFNRYFGMATAAVASLTGIVFGFKKISEEAAKLDDVYSDVMKTTGMTRDEVVELNEELKKIDTRTSREQLNMLARDAGKLGITGKKDILDFVDAGNQINVALGEDLGEDAIKQIGKMVGVYKGATDEITNLDLKGQMLAVGSAINELGASSTASEPYLVQFAGRLGGVAAQADISMSAILGYASALDQDMQAVEMSATALQNFIMKLMGDPAKFAKLAGLEVKGFTDLLKTDANAAIKQVLKSLNEKGGFEDLIPVFQEMGLDGARAVGVLSSMASSIDKIDEAQLVANKSMIEGISLTNEYNIKNDNKAAKLEKARKALREMAFELGDHLSPALLVSTNTMSYMVKITINLIKFVQQYGSVIATTAATIVTYTIAVNAATIAIKAKQTWLLLAEKAQKLFNATAKANPYVLVASAVAGLVTWLITYTKRTKEAAEAQKKLNEYLEDTEEIMNRTKSIDDRSKTMQNMSREQLERFKEDAKQELEYFNELEDKKLLAARAYQVEVEKLEKYVSDNASNEAEKRALYSNTYVTAARDEAFRKFSEISQFIDQNKSKLDEYIAQANKMLNKPDKGKSKTNASGETFEDWKKANDLRQDMLRVLDSTKQTRDEIEMTFDEAWNANFRMPDEDMPDLSASDFMGELMQAQQLDLKRQYAEGLIDQETYHQLSEDLEIGHLMTMLELRRQLGEDTTEIESQILDYRLQKQQENAEQQIQLNEQIVDTALSSAQQVSDAIFQIKQNQINAELDARLAAIDRARDAELANQNLTEEEKEAINEKYRKKEAAIKLAAWKKERNAALAQAAINGALSVTKTFAYYGFTPAGWLAAGAQAVATAAQIAVIASQKPPEFRKGGYTDQAASDDQPAGIVHTNEFVASADAVRNPTIRPVLDVIKYAQDAGTVRSINLPAVIQSQGFKSGGYAGVSDQPVSADDHGIDSAQMIEAMNRFAAAVDRLQADGVQGKWIYQDFKTMAQKEESAIAKTA